MYHFINFIFFDLYEKRYNILLIFALIQEIINQISKTPINDNILYVCVDDENIQFLILLRQFQLFI